MGLLDILWIAAMVAGVTAACLVLYSLLVVSSNADDMMEECPGDCANCWRVSSCEHRPEPLHQAGHLRYMG